MVGGGGARSGRSSTNSASRRVSSSVFRRKSFTVKPEASLRGASAVAVSPGRRLTLIKIEESTNARAERTFADLAFR